MITVVSAPATGPDILAQAAILFSAVVGPGPMMASDLHTSLTNAAGLLRAGEDRAQALRLADEAADMLAAFLADQGATDVGVPTSRALRGWMVVQHRRRPVETALQAAADWYRERLPHPDDAPAGEMAMAA